MIRSVVLAALALAVLAPTRAGAQPPFDPTPGGFRIVDAKADKGKLTWTETVAVPVVKEVEVIMMIDGKPVAVKKKVTTIEYVSVAKTGDLKGAKVTDAAGKAIDADKIAERLKETTPVVFVSGPVPAKHRELFKDTTVFVEFPQPKGPVPFPVPPAPAPAPPVVPVPPVPLPISPKNG